jgi:glycerophosphoryl diester phosphodiesterase
VIPWTFRDRDTGAFPDVEREMAHFVCELGVDGVFTDNPDRFPGTAECAPDD